MTMSIYAHRSCTMREGRRHRHQRRHLVCHTYASIARRAVLMATTTSAGGLSLDRYIRKKKTELNVDEVRKVGEALEGVVGSAREVERLDDRDAVVARIIELRKALRANEMKGLRENLRAASELSPALATNSQTIIDELENFDAGLLAAGRGLADFPDIASVTHARDLVLEIVATAEKDANAS